ncbi:hypothetical protein CC2G_001622 [Coprinopsis cinerea AmutBmut pab1-1]|nr:hypothetical protein CC2G_001622 [Coprinopsis cinerea AmutBmut pab1-1]
MASGKLPIFHVTADNFVPSLLESEVEKIDNLLSRGRSAKVPSAEIKNQVLGSKRNRPEVASSWKHRQARQCSYCEEIKEKGLMICSRCKLAHYCSKECQRLAWPSHKLLCKKA